MDAIIMKYGKLRVFFVSCCFFAILWVIEILIMANVCNTLIYKGNKLSVLEINAKRVVLSDTDGNKLTMTVETHMAANVLRTHRIKYLSETILYSYEFGQDAVYTFSDGSTFVQPSIQVRYNTSPDFFPDVYLSSVQKAEKQLIDKLINNSFLGYASFVGIALIGLVLLMLAHGHFFFPEFFWHLETFLSVRGGEPTDLYIFMTKVFSVISMVAIYVGVIYIVTEAV